MIDIIIIYLYLNKGLIPFIPNKNMLLQRSFELCLVDRRLIQWIDSWTILLVKSKPNMIRLFVNLKTSSLTCNTTIVLQLQVLYLFSFFFFNVRDIFIPLWPTLKKKHSTPRDAHGSSTRIVMGWEPRAPLYQLNPLSPHFFSFETTASAIFH